MVALLKILFLNTAYALELQDGLKDAGCNFKDGGPPDGAMWYCIPKYISNVTFVVASMAASLSLLLLMYNGFRYMLMPAIGESSDAAKKGIIYSLVGMVVSLMSYIILDTIVTSVTGST